MTIVVVFLNKHISIRLPLQEYCKVYIDLAEIWDQNNLKYAEIQKALFFLKMKLYKYFNESAK